jgi:homoaconitate hydratase
VGQTLVEKVAQRHAAGGAAAGERTLRAGDFVSLRPHRVLTHDNTAPVMKKFLAIGAARVHDPSQPVFVLDHDIQNRSAENLAKYASIERFAREQGIDFHPAGTGIGHQVMVERLYAVPGALVVASDSHANMYGGVGAVGTPVVRTDAAAIWATGTFWWQIPRTVRVELAGKLPPGATGKDVIVALCGTFDHGEVLNAAVEFGGPGVATLGIEERLAIANMTTEWGALVGWFPVDATTLAYVERRRAVLAERGEEERVDAGQLRAWRESPPLPDPDASYAGLIELDLASVQPHVAGPDSVQVTASVAEMERREVAIHKAYLVSCVNSRLDDIAAAAAVLRGKRIADGVEMYVAAASAEVQAGAEKRGDWQALLDAGARPLPPGCGPCIGLGAGLLEPGEVGISSTNRNFKGRMGSRDAQCYLASPAVVAASALAGRIRAPLPVRDEPPRARFEARDEPQPAAESVEILAGFPARLEGRLVFLPQDNLNTDGIYGKDYTYRDDMTPAAMARVIFENYEPALAGATRRGDVIVGSRNFGTGSSREQAVTALQAAGIALVIAASFSQTYLRNAFNNGFPCVTSPALVRRLHELCAAAIEAGERSIVPGDRLQVDFTTGTVQLRSESFRFPPLGAVPQALVVAGGVENQVRRTLGIE